ncbi:MAG: beta-lactamase family protein [Ruminococcaceae bacterium]|nr:beta-lactamase family protein [Oscillospiraceae bacterium]
MDFTPMKAFMDRLTAWRIPGNSISVCLENKEVFTYQSGYDSMERKTKMSGDRLFNIFSCSKPLTVTAALQLYEKGYFLLDDPLYDFIPEYKRMMIKDADGNLTEAKKPITLRHLFTMTAGLTYASNTPAFDKARALTDGKMNTLSVIKCLAEDPLSFEPGERWQYSLCHDVLAAVVEVISGKRFRDYVRENIFAPLGMNDSYYHNEAVLDRVAEMYRYENSAESDIVKLQSASAGTQAGHAVNVGKAVSHVFGNEYDSGGAGVTTSVSDYSKFASALANGGVGRTGEQILSPGTIELLRTNQLSEAQSVNFTWPQLRGYGYGLGVRTLTDIAKSGSCGSLGEFGWGGAAGATVLVDPSLKLSVFYTHHMLNPHEEYYQPRLRNVLYTCLGRRIP